MPKSVLEISIPFKSGVSKRSRHASKHSHLQMQSSRLIEGLDVISTFIVVLLYRISQRPNVELLIHIFQEFYEKTKECRPLGRYFTSDVNVYRRHKET